MDTFICSACSFVFFLTDKLKPKKENMSTKGEIRQDCSTPPLNISLFITFLMKSFLD